MPCFPHVAHHGSPGGPLDRKIRASRREAKAQHAANTCLQLEATLRACDYRAAWEHCRLLAGHSRRSVEPRAVCPEKALDAVELAAHMKNVFGATSSPAPPQSSASASPAWRSLCRTSCSSQEGAQEGERNGDDDTVDSCRATQVSLRSGGSTHTWSANSSQHTLVLCLGMSHTAR